MAESILIDLLGGLWRDDAVVLIAGGPSLTLAQIRLIGIARASDLIKVVAINDAIYPAMFADILYACDHKFWRHHGVIPPYRGVRVSLESTPYPEVIGLKHTGMTGYDPCLGRMRSGGNSGYQALHLVAQLGAKRVILVGFDMQGSHWFGDHPLPIRSTKPVMATRIEAFNDLAATMKMMHIEVMNASPGSALACFPRVDLRDALVAEEKRHGTAGQRLAQEG